MRRRYYTEAVIFVANTTFSIYIFAFANRRRWPEPSGELQATGVITQKSIVRRP